MKPAARGLFCPLLCPPQKKIAKKNAQNICLFEKYIYLCSAYLLLIGAAAPNKGAFFMHIAKY